MTEQGKGPLTRLKQDHLRGIIKILLNTQQARIRDGRVQLRIHDCMCGVGENEIFGLTIDGSPRSIITAASNQFDALIGDGCTEDMAENLHFLFTDIRQKATEKLNRILAHGYQMGGLRFGPHPHLTPSPNSPDSFVTIETKEAADAILESADYLSRSGKNRLVLLVDPNGPKALPYPELKNLLTSIFTRNKVAVILYIAATAIKRIRKSGYGPAWVSGFREMLLDGFKAAGNSWIRKPVPGDAWQWTMICYYGKSFAPRHDWKKAGFIRLDDASADEVIRALDLTKDEKKNVRV